jgi:hypothetical protein
MTRARAKAIEDKVNSLLSELPLSTYETWLLPQAETLCVIRYLEEGHGAATPNEQDGEGTKYKDQERKLSEADSHRTTGPRQTTDAWSIHRSAQVPPSEDTSARTTDSYRTTDALQPPDDRPHHHRAKMSEVWKPPDDRRLGRPTPTG